MKNIIWIGIISIILLSGCRSIQTVDVPLASRLTPYIPLENIPVLLATSLPEAVIKPVPAATAVPKVHIVALGETFSSIALQYGVTIDAIKEANPGTNPNTLIVGDELKIPNTEQFTSTVLDPEIGKDIHFFNVNCVPSRDSGLWCAVLVENKGANDLEDLVIAFSFLDVDGNLIEEKYTPSLMRRLLTGNSIPAVVFLHTAPVNFDRVTTKVFSTQVMDISIEGPFSIDIEDERQSINGIEAIISGKMQVVSSQDFDRVDVWIGAAAFDEDGGLIGVRRVENTVAPNEPFDFNLTVYAAESSIAQVKLYFEVF